MPDAKEPTWTVTGQVEDFGPDAIGNYVSGVKVSFRTANGAQGSVFIPAAEYSVDRARQLIGAAARAMAEVQELSG